MVGDPVLELFQTSLLLRRFVFRMAEASAKRVTSDEPQGTMGRVQSAGEARCPKRSLARCLLPAFHCAHIFIKRETSGYEAGFKRFTKKRQDYNCDKLLSFVDEKISCALDHKTP